ncbi:tetratricopeptide repeat protein [bacterium]|nr:tetratricopeptide repeat protein [bacterium]
MPHVENLPRLTAARAVSFAAVLCCAAALTGCRSTGESNAWMPTADAEAQLKDPEALRLSFARMSEQRGDYKAAREAYLQASTENPKSPEAILGLARLDLLAGRIQSAERLFLQAYQIAPENSLVIESLGQFYLTQDRFDEAVRHLSRGIELTPGNSRMRHRLAVALAKQGNIAAAEPHFIQSVGEAEADYNIGLILYEQGEVKQAEQRFLSAVLKKPTLAQAQHWLDAVRQETARTAETKLASTSKPETARQPIQQTASQQPQTPPIQVPPSEQTQSLPGQQVTTVSQPGITTQQYPIQSAIPTQPRSIGPAAAPTQSPGLDLSTLNATQLEQLENSLSPEDRIRLHTCLRAGTRFVRQAG